MITLNYYCYKARKELGKKMKIKIFQACQNFYPVKGGIETLVLETSRELAKMGYEITVVTSNRTTENSKKLPAKEKISGINIRRFNFKKISRYKTSLDALKFLLSSDFDILHVHGIGFLSDIIPLVKSEGNKKIVLNTHGGIFHTKKMMFAKNIYFNTMTRIAAKFTDKIVADSEHDKEIMERIADKKKISVIGHGVAWQRLSKIRRNGNGKTLIHFGRVASNKKIDKILHVVKILKKSIHDVKFFVVGADWGELKKLKELTNKLGIKKNVIFTGEVSEKKLYQIMSKSDLFVLASEYEGFGISVIEAMAAGLPVVVNDIDAMKELVQNGKNGFRINFNDYDCVAKTILRLLEDNDLRKKIEASNRSYTKNFDWSSVAKNIDKVYKEVISSN
jgi:alpha-1,3-mannosyltransferase